MNKNMNERIRWKKQFPYRQKNKSNLSRKKEVKRFAQLNMFVEKSLPCYIAIVNGKSMRKTGLPCIFSI